MTYRNRRLLDAISNAPKCFFCDTPNDGTVVACHSNSGSDGKGMGMKASDAAIAGGCFKCHTALDSGKDMLRAQKREAWLQAHVKTMRWLFESGVVEVVRA